MIYLKPLTRRIIYVATFEVIAIAASTLLLSLLSGGPAHDSLPVAAAVSAIAVAWNYIFNTLFEAWERRTHRSSRSLALRSVHAIAFEGGLFLFTIPLYMGWYHVGLWEAVKMEAALLLFFLFYTFLFTLAFDMIFALPGQKEKQPAAPQTARAESVAAEASR
ncbi:PACE efflux transporter [Kerstersia gyiorum]|uniref:PACE efflux transporter n=1 Tax=Kerstersia gyiorum TaxID=206506 RepID=UPI0020A1F0F4|nr:PACE efflux transporter [Kerstersia gyiorum]MCP1632411.1 putative membrane protein [Kerstersia gyiorum]MCP1669991.1 putative membrane protein [Kerstersia gyiorum]MCP1678132.1 putative membrane protein [Kerstersia gyiorum]MCP1680867.1 putative membrane protein [Kerstersia gyiorum]MCP1707896.1 putative membrane protein [Kerstersia gyiorum]